MARGPVCGLLFSRAEVRQSQTWSRQSLCVQSVPGLHHGQQVLMSTSAFFPSKLKPSYSMEESSELMDIGIHSVISLQPPREDNEAIKVGPLVPDTAGPGQSRRPQLPAPL